MHTRRGGQHRNYVVGKDFEQFAAALRNADPATVFDAESPASEGHNTSGNPVAGRRGHAAHGGRVGHVARFPSFETAAGSPGNGRTLANNVEDAGSVHSFGSNGTDSSVSAIARGMHRGGLIANLIAVCEERAQDRLDASSMASILFDTSSQPSLDRNVWKQEANAWRLVRDLLQYRASIGALAESPESGEDTMEDTVENGNRMNDFSSTALFLASDRQRIEIADRKLQELLIVKEWLERTAPEFTPCKVKKGYFVSTVESIRRSATSVTRTQTTTRVSTFSTLGASQGEIVTSADPDAKFREQSRNLTREDAEYEEEVDKTAFNYLRRGKFDDAKDLFERTDQPWKAASISGGILWKDKVYDRLSLEVAMNGDAELQEDFEDMLVDYAEGDMLNFEGNHNREMWKQVCRQIAMNNKASTYERALYSVLASTADHILPVCSTWEDVLWASYTVLIEKFVSARLASEESYLVDFYDSFDVMGETETETLLSSPSKAFELINSPNQKAQIKNAAKDPFHTLLQYFILDNVSTFLRDVKTKLELFTTDDIETPYSTPHFLRFITHFIIIALEYGFNYDQEACAYIIRYFVDILIRSRKDSLVALYTSFLDPKVQVDVYSDFLMARPQGNSSSIDLLLLAYTYKLDVASIIQTLIQKSVQSTIIDTTFPAELTSRITINSLDDPITASERLMINAVGWLLDFRLTESHIVSYNGNTAGIADNFSRNGTEQFTIGARDPERSDAYLGQALLLINLLCRNFLLNYRVNCLSEIFKFLEIKFNTTNVEEKFTRRVDWIEQENDFGVGIVEFCGYKYALTCFQIWRDWNMSYQVYTKHLSRTSGGRLSVKQTHPNVVTKFTSDTEKCIKAFKQIFSCDWLLSLDEEDETDNPELDQATLLRTKELDRIRLIYLPKFTVCYLHLLIETEDWNHSSTRSIKPILSWIKAGHAPTATVTSKNTDGDDTADVMYEQDYGMGLTKEAIEYSLKHWQDWDWIMSKYNEYF